jgi:hypothetical protein
MQAVAKWSSFSLEWRRTQAAGSLWSVNLHTSFQVVRWNCFTLYCYKHGKFISDSDYSTVAPSTSLSDLHHKSKQSIIDIDLLTYVYFGFLNHCKEDKCHDVRLQVNNNIVPFILCSKLILVWNTRHVYLENKILSNGSYLVYMNNLSHVYQ